MNVVTDEDVDGAVVQRLRDDGHDVIYVAELFARHDRRGRSGTSERSWCSLCHDGKDFGELVFRQRLIHSGVLLLRLAGLANPTKAEIVAEVFRDRGAELLDAFGVVSPGQIRIRRGL